MIINVSDQCADPNENTEKPAFAAGNLLFSNTIHMEDNMSDEQNKPSLLIVRASMMRIMGLKYSAADYREAATMALEFAEQYELSAKGYRARTELKLSAVILVQMLYPQPRHDDAKVELVVSRQEEKQKIELPPLDLDPLSSMSVIEQMEIMAPLYRQAAEFAVRMAEKHEKDADFQIEELKKSEDPMLVEKLLMPALTRIRRKHVNFWVIVNGIDIQSYIDELKQEAYKPPKQKEDEQSYIRPRKTPGTKLN